MRKKLYKWEDPDDYRIEPLIGRARVHIHRADGEVAGPFKSKWRAYRNPVRDMAAISIVGRVKTTVSANDIGGTAQTFYALTDDGARTFNDEGIGANFEVQLHWGTNGTAETGDEDSLIAKSDTVPPTSDTLDMTGNTYSVQGSKVWEGGTTETLREVAFVREYETTGSGAVNVLVDRAVVTDETVNDGDTVTITYDWAWS